MGAMDTEKIIKDPQSRQLLGFPEEILIQIFQAVHDTPPDSNRQNDEERARYDQGTRDIQSIRLTCRKFNRLSSEFLIKFVGVDISENSLTRLQSIMEQPAICKGVRMIRIRLLAYDPFLHRNQFAYVHEMVRHLELYSPLMKKDARLLANYYVEAWRTGRWTGIRHLFAGLGIHHQLYSLRYCEQHFVSQQKFLAVVLNALQRSKQKLRIEITDCNDFGRQYQQTIRRATIYNLLSTIARPRGSTWLQLHRFHPHAPRSFEWMIPSLLAAFNDPSIHISELHFEITRTRRPQPMAFSEEMSRSIQLALQDLQKFKYTSHAYPGNRLPEPDMKCQLYSCLPPKSLKELCLRRVELEPQRQWSNLQKIALMEVQFDVERLASLLQPIEPHTAAIRLRKCRLSEGSWADVIDLLRSKQREAVLISPMGQEVIWMSPENRNYLFVHLADWHDGNSKAEQYIRGWIDDNPIRQHDG